MKKSRSAAAPDAAKNQQTLQDQHLGATPEHLDNMRDAAREAADLGNGHHPPGSSGWEKRSKAAVATAIVDAEVEAGRKRLGRELEDDKPTVARCENTGKSGSRPSGRNRTTGNECFICKTRMKF